MTLHTQRLQIIHVVRTPVRQSNHMIQLKRRRYRKQPTLVTGIPLPVGDVYTQRLVQRTLPFLPQRSNKYFQRRKMR